MNEKRIYGQKIQINTEHIRTFYDKRASTSSAGNAGTVLLGNQDPQFVAQANAYDRDYILPMLGIYSSARVLDIGCGIGRWAGFILPDCGFYCGIDFSQEMLSIANKVCQGSGGKYALHCMPAAQVVEHDAVFYGGRFGAVIMSGVCAYINDNDLAQLFCKMPGLLEDHCAVLVNEPVGLQTRLTLNDFPSEALQTEYSAIYRTVGEYMELCKPLLEAGFSIVKQEFRPKFGDDYSDTGRYHIVFQR